MSKTINLSGNDVIGSGIAEVYWSDNGRAISPLGFEFVRVEDGKPYKQSFNLHRESAKRLAMFILENL